jgi:hypothetical protein
MPTRTLRIGVLATLRPAATKWGTATLKPCAVLWPAPALACGALAGAEGAVERRYLGDHGLTFHSGDTGHQRDNLTSASPSVWVVLADADDPPRAAVRLVTVDPYEGGGMADDPALTVEAVPLPQALADEMAAFIAIHHVEVPFKKRKRGPASTGSDPRAPRILRPEDKWGRR